MKFPEIKRAAELDHFSEGWPSLSESSTRTVRSACCRIAILLTLVAAALPIVGVKLFLGNYPDHYSIKLYADFLFTQLMAPVFLLLLEGLIGYCTFFQKRIPLWVLLIGLVGAFGMFWNSGKGSHNFSHELFNSCTGYVDLISWLAASIALLLTAIWLLEFRIPRGQNWLKMRMTKGMRRAFGLLLILACWLGLLSLFEII